MALSADEVERIFKEAGALLEGHFVLASGRHSARYLEKFRVFAQPRLTERLCTGIVERITAPVDVVAGPTTGGLLLAHEIARQMGVRAAYAEHDEERHGRAFRRGHVPRARERVLVVDDILSTGGSVRETLAALRAVEAAIVGVAVLVDRSGGTNFGVPLTSLWTTRIETFEPSSCPLCAGGVPAVKPGTSRAAAAASS